MNNNPTFDEVKIFGLQNEFEAKVVEDWFHLMQNQNWTISNGEPVRAWRTILTRHVGFLEAKEAKEVAAGRLSFSLFPPKSKEVIDGENQIKQAYKQMKNEQSNIGD